MWHIKVIKLLAVRDSKYNDKLFSKFKKGYGKKRFQGKY